MVDLPEEMGESDPQSKASKKLDDKGLTQLK